MAEVVCKNADAVWVCTHGDVDGGRLYGRDWVHHSNMSFVVAMPKGTQTVVHHKFVMLNWRNNRYEVDGGIMLAIGPQTATSMKLKHHTWDTKLVETDPFAVTPPEKTIVDPMYEFSVKMWIKKDVNTQWFDGEVVNDPRIILNVRLPSTAAKSLMVTDVSGGYATLANIVTSHVKRRVTHMYSDNKSSRIHPDLSASHLGLIRQATLRPDYPWCASPGLCMPECLGNRVSTATYDNLILATRFVTSFNEKAFFALLDIPNDYPLEHVEEACKNALTTLMHTTCLDKHNQALQTMEAFAVIMLGLGGSHYGYNDEKIDDQSCPPIKMGSNSDCEDFAIAAVGLLTRIMSKEGEKLFCRNSCTIMGRLVAWFCRTAFSRAMVATGYVNLGIARPDMKTDKSQMSGHGWVMVQLQQHYRPQDRMNMRYFPVECTAPYVPHGIPPGTNMEKYDLDATQKKQIEMDKGISKSQKKLLIEMLIRQSPIWLAQASMELYGGAMMLIRDMALEMLPGTVGPAHFMDVDENGIAFKYRTVATLSDAHNSFTVVPNGYDHDIKTTGLDKAHTKSSADPITQKRDYGPLIPIHPNILNNTSVRVEVGVTMNMFMTNKYSLRTVASDDMKQLFQNVFGGFMVNPELDARADNLSEFIEVEHGLRTRRFENVIPVPPKQTTWLNQVPPERQLQFKDSAMKTKTMRTDRLPEHACTLIPAIVFQSIMKGVFVDTKTPIALFPIRFLFSDMLVLGRFDVAIFANVEETDLFKTHSRQQDPHVDAKDDAAKVHAWTIEHHPGYKQMAKCQKSISRVSRP